MKNFALLGLIPMLLLFHLLDYALEKTELVEHLQWSLLDKTESAWTEEGRPDVKPISSPEMWER